MPLETVALSTLKMGFKQHLAPNVCCFFFIHTECTPHYLPGLTDWLCRLINYLLSCIVMGGGGFFLCATLFCLPSAMLSHKGKIERGRKLLVANLSQHQQ